MLRRVLVLAFAAACLARSAAAEAIHLPAVARPVLPGDGTDPSRETTVFFLPAVNEIGVAAVGTAHSFDLAVLAAQQRLELRLAKSGALVAVSGGLLSQPGRSFRNPGSSLRDDFMVFALDARPFGVRVLEPERGGAPAKGTRVRVIGIPRSGPQDDDDVFGSVASADDRRIEVLLDTPVDLRGWGGAPVLDAESDRVIGILQAAWVDDQGLRLGVAPIGGVIEAIDAPYDNGLGRPFAQFSDPASTAAVAAARPKPAPAERAPAPPASKPAPAAGGEPRPAAPPAPRPEEWAETDRPEPSAPPPTRARSARGASAPSGPDATQTALFEGEGGPATILLAVEHPNDGAVVGDATGAFVAGRALALHGALRRFDALIVLDTSGSTAAPSGSDINRNGHVGRAAGWVFGSIVGLPSTDPGDSILAAEVEAARRVLRSLDPRSTRVGLVTFAGDSLQDPGVFSTRAPRRPAITEEALTTEYERIEQALDHVLERGPEGATHMAAGVDQATTELLGLRGGMSEPDRGSEKVVLFFTDGTPTLPYDDIAYMGDNVRAVLRAADRAQRAGVVIHTFAIGPEALDGPIAPVEMASRTRGVFTPVRDPSDLVDVMEEVNFANVEAIEVKNETTGAAADVVNANPDGSWSALVPLAVGKNRLRVVAHANDGSTASQDLLVHYAPDAPTPPVPAGLVAQRNRVLQQKLLEVRSGTLQVEREAVEHTRKELQIEIENERARAQERAARQRKELSIEPERADWTEPDPSGG
jgi:hypothetical protein